MEPQEHPHYSPHFLPYAEARQRYALLVGGAGSGKSYSAALKCIHRCCVEPGARILVVRKVARTLKRSCFQLCKDLISQLGLADEFKALVSELRIEHRNTGAQLLFSGIDDPEKIKSIQGISSVWIEEATELDVEDFFQLSLRLRGATPGYKQITLTCNPTDEESWIFSQFADPALPPNADLFHLRSTYKDNPYLDPEYVTVLEEHLRTDENLYRIYTQGIWGRKVKKDLFYKQFDTRKHLIAIEKPDPDLPLHISVDFNVQPYITATVWQIEGLEARQIDEVCLEGPRNAVPDLAAELLNRYGYEWPAGVNLYGDPSGRNRHSAGPLTYFDQMRQGLAPWQPRIRVARAAPAVPARGQWINRILGVELDGIAIRIGTHCAKTLADYAHVRETAEGTKFKLRTSEDKGPTFEPYGHCSDANDYLLCQVFAESWRSFGRGGKPPLVFSKPVKQKGGRGGFRAL